MEQNPYSAVHAQYNEHHMCIILRHMHYYLTLRIAMLAYLAVQDLQVNTYCAIPH